MRQMIAGAATFLLACAVMAPVAAHPAPGDGGHDPAGPRLTAPAGAPTPVPAAFPLLAAAFGLMGVLRLRAR